MDLNLIIKEGLSKALLSSYTAHPRHTHRISDVGHPCHRYLYYAITQWDKSSVPDESLLAIFKLGHRMENQVFDFFNSEVGPACTPKLRILRQGTPMTDKIFSEYKISGTTDGVLAYEASEGQYEPLGVIDAKSCSQGSFNQYKSLESMKRHTWSSLYPTQVQLYSFGENLPKGYLFFVSKQNMFHDWTLIEVPVDYEHVEGVLQKCKSVNEHIEAEVEPDKLNQPFWCRGCRFESLCLPELEVDGEGPVMNDSEEIESLIERVNELKPYAKEYDDLYKELKGKLVRGQTLVSENYMLEWSEVTINRKAASAYSTTSWRLKMIPIGKEDEDE